MKALFSVLFALVLVSLPVPALADFVNQDIEDTDLMTSDWVKQYGTANVNAGWPQDVSGPGVRWKATPTATSGWIKIGVGDNFSIRTGTYGFPTIWVGSGYFADWTGHATYQLAFTNNSAASYVFVKPYYTTGSAGYWHDASTWVAPGETRVVSIDLTTLAGGEPGLVPNLATVSHFGFELGMNYANPPTVYGEGNEFDVTVSAQFPVHNVTQDTWHLTIQDGVNNAVANDQLTVASGTYAEALEIAADGIELLGAGSGSVTINAAGLAGYNSSGIHVTGDNVSLQGFRLVGTTASALPRYGIKLNQVTGVSMTDVLVETCYRTGIDILGGGSHTLTGVESRNNGGNGIQSTDTNGISYSGITTSGNAWGGVGVFTNGHYSPIGTSGIVFAGINSFGETTAAVGGLYLEEGNYSNPSSPEPITWSTNPLDLADVTIQIVDVTHFMKGDSDASEIYTRFYQTLADAQSAAAGAVSHILGNRYIGEIDGSNWYVPSYLGGIQAAINAASPGDAVHVDAGLYDERIAINKSITLLGATSGVSKRGYAVPAGYAYAAATESIIRPSAPLELQVVKVAADGVVFDGFVVANEVCATGGVYQDLIGIDPSMTATTGVQILNCVLGPNTNTASQDGTKGRSGVTVYGPRALPLKLVVMHNKIFDSKGNGCGIMIVGPYGPSYYGGVPHVNQFAGSVIEDNDILGNHRTGIELAGGVQGGTAWADHVIIRDNLIAENGWFALAEKDNLKYGHGIMFIRCGGDKANADAAGSQYVRLEDNEISDNEKSGLYIGPKNSDLFGTGNVIQDNGLGTGGYSLWDGVRVDLAELYYGGAALADYGFLTNVSFEEGGILGNGALGANVMQTPTAGPVSAICNWWGDILGPNVPPANPSSGDGVVGSVVYAPWLDGLGGVCNQYGDNYVSAEPPDTCLSVANTCMTVPVMFNRSDTTPLRGTTVTFQLSPEIELCAGVASVTPGLLMDGSYMEVVDNEDGSYTVDQAFLGGTALDCGPVTGGTLFTIGVKPSAGASTDDTGTITILSVDARDCANPFNVLPGIPGPAAEITIDRTAPAAVIGLAAVQVKSGNDTDGTTKITLTFTAPGDAVQTLVYRKGFGFYPEYDDDGGAAPTAPVTPTAAAAAGWILTPVILSGQADEPATRDFWYYVAFVTDACGNVSAVSNRTDGTLNYHLGDVMPSATPPPYGDNQVAFQDVSFLGGHYGVADGNPLYENILDIGPTTDSSTNGLPTTDSKIQFEDLIIFSINYGGVGKPMPASLGADRNAVALTVAPSTDGIEAVMTLSSTGAVQGVSLPLLWNAEAVEPIATRSGEMVNRQSGRALVLSPEAGTVDAAVFGSTFAGTGELAVVTFRVIGSGDPRIRFGEVIARDGENHPIALETAVERRDLPVTPTVTRLLPSAPNPFLGATQIRFSLAEPMPVAVRIYAVDGRLVRTLVDATLASGEKTLAWDGRDDSGRLTAAGAYLLRLETRTVVESQRIMRLQ